MVPMVPTRRPAASSPASTRKAVVVLPLVPVMPNIVIRSAGWPKMRAETRAIAGRSRSATTIGTPATPPPSVPPWVPASARSCRPSASVRIPAAPEATAWPANRAPWKRVPGSPT
jgi:hypothetical protein